MIRARSVALVAAPAVAVLGGGFLIGYPAQVAAATTIAFAAVISLISTRDLAAGAELRPPRVRRVADSPPLEQLRQVDRALTAAQASEVGVDRDLRPLFRPIAAMRLARRGVHRHRPPAVARAFPGAQLGVFARPRRERGSNLVAGGISTVGLESLIERLERI